MKNNLLEQWQKYVELLIVNHGKIFALGLLTGWLYRLSKNDPCIRIELSERLEKEEKLAND